MTRLDKLRHLYAAVGVRFVDNAAPSDLAIRTRGHAHIHRCLWTALLATVSGSAHAPAMTNACAK